MNFKNYYEILKVDKNSSLEEIKKSYFQIVKLYHPDLNPNSESLFIETQEAYEILSDNVKRKEFNLELKSTFLEILII